MTAIFFSEIWIASVILGVSVWDDRGLWNAVVSGAKTNLIEMDYACEYTFKDGYAITLDDALSGNCRRVSDSQLYDFTEATGQIVKLGDNLRFKIIFVNPTDYHDAAGSYSMRSEDRMIGQDVSVTYVPPQRSIFTDNISTGVVYAFQLAPDIDRFRLSHHSSFINRSPFWASINQLKQFEPTDGFDPIKSVKLLKMDSDIAQFHIERRDFPPCVVEFDTQGEYPVLTYVGNELDARTGHRFSDIRTRHDGFRCPLKYTFIEGPVELKGVDGVVWGSTVWIAKDFVDTPDSEDFNMEWPDGTLVAGHMNKDVNRVNLFEMPEFIPSPTLSIQDQSSDIANQEKEVGSSWYWYGATIVVLLMVFAVSRFVFRALA